MEYSKYDMSYMFFYSERPGTLAQRRYTDDVPEEIKKRRLQEIVELQNRLSFESNQRDIGKTFKVLIEGDSKRSADDWMGRNTQNKVIVFPKENSNFKKGDYVMVKVTDCTQATLLGKLDELRKNTMADIQSIKNRFGIIGNSPALNYALQVAVQVANTDLTVLIVGESGVGKEVFSMIIHSLSARKHNPFIAVNCGAIPEGTIDSELFGHEKGSFTGAVDSRKGYFETVNGGTIFLDEIGEMPLGTQARLLRVLETGEFIRVGSSKVQKTDVRVIAATNKDLLESVNNGKFREDLYYRLNTVPIRVPALKDRKEDIILLFRKFAVDFAEKYKTAPVQLDDEAKNLLINYPWPGNVRELKNIAEQISVLSQDKQVHARELENFYLNILTGYRYLHIPMGRQDRNLPMKEKFFTSFSSI